MSNPKKIETVHAETLDGELCLYDWQRTEVHSLNPTAATVWTLCDGQTSPQQMAEHLQTNTELDSAQAEALVWLTLVRLEEAHLLENGRKLTDEERDLLDANRDALIAQIKGLEEEFIQAEKRREQALKIVEHREVAKPVDIPATLRKSVQKPISQPRVTNPPRIEPSSPINYNEHSHRYTIIFRNQAGEIFKQLYRGDEQFCRRFIEREIENYPQGHKRRLQLPRQGRQYISREKYNCSNYRA